MEPTNAVGRGKMAVRPLLSVSSNTQGTTQIVVVTGELDIASIDRVGSAVDRALADDPETVLLDLSQVDFCDSSGVHLVLRTHRRTQGSRTHLRVVPPTGTARRVFDICCVEDYVTFVSSASTEETSSS
jgi:anti-sigma B factor antagonist